jgi:hypothetical protein
MSPPNDADVPPVDECFLDTAPPNTTLRFTIPKTGGYVADATLFQGTKMVASWESIEILGKTTEEELIPTGLYTLMINVTFTKPEKATVTMEFSTHDEDGAELDKDTTRLSGKKPVIGRSMTTLMIAKP